MNLKKLCALLTAIAALSSLHLVARADQGFAGFSNGNFTFNHIDNTDAGNTFKNDGTSLVTYQDFTTGTEVDYDAKMTLTSIAEGPSQVGGGFYNQKLQNISLMFTQVGGANDGQLLLGVMGKASLTGKLGTQGVNFNADNLVTFQDVTYSSQVFSAYLASQGSHNSYSGSFQLVSQSVVTKSPGNDYLDTFHAQLGGGNFNIDAVPEASTLLGFGSLLGGGLLGMRRMRRVKVA